MIQTDTEIAVTITLKPEGSDPVTYTWTRDEAIAIRDALTRLSLTVPRPPAINGMTPRGSYDSTRAGVVHGIPTAAEQLGGL